MVSAAALSAAALSACAGEAGTTTGGTTTTTQPPTTQPTPPQPTATPLTQPTTTQPTAPPPTPAPPTPAPPTPAPTTTQPPTTAAPPDPGTVLALDLARAIPVEREHRGPPDYDRDDWPHWRDADRDGLDTRDEVLVAESLTPAQIDPFGPGVVAGDWLSVYDGRETASPGDLQIDHVVALAEAHDSGGWAWDEATRTAFANDLDDPRSLIAVSAESNQAKGAKDPSNWLPPREAALCPYLGDWVAVKARWGLSMDPSEAGRVVKLLEGPCAGWRVATPVAAPVRRG
jgi:hypothetical protein